MENKRRNNYYNILGEVKYIIRDYFNIPIEKINKTSSIISDLNLDSLDRIELCLGLEDKFGIFMSEDVEDKFTDTYNVGEFSKYVCMLVKEKNKRKDVKELHILKKDAKKEEFKLEKRVKKNTKLVNYLRS